MAEDQALPSEEALAQPHTSTRFGALRHPDFRFLLAGNLFTQLGQWSQQLGKGWLVVNDLDGSAFQLGLVAFTQGLGMFIMAPIGGVLADRFNRRHLMLMSQVILAAIALTLAVLVMTDVITIWMVYIIAFLSGSFFGLNNPARMSAIHDIVGREDLGHAVALNAVVMNSMRVIGPALGGVLLVVVGTEGAFFLQAGGYLGGVSAVLLMRQKFTARGGSAPFLKSMVDGVRYARSDRVIAVILTVAFLTSILGLSMMQLIAAFVKDVLDQDETGFAILFIMLGVGGLAGAVLLVMKSDISNRGLLYFCAAFGTGILITALGAAGNLTFSYFAMIGLGATTGFSLALGNTLIQTNVKDEYRGRAMSLYFLSFSLSPMGALIGGAVGDLIDLRIAFMAIGLSLAAPIGWILLTRRDMWRM